MNRKIIKFSDQIAKLRQAKNMTQSKLARKIGISQQFVARLENSEKTIPSIRTLQKVAHSLNRELFVEFR